MRESNRSLPFMFVGKEVRQGRRGVGGGWDEEKGMSSFDEEAGELERVSSGVGGIESPRAAVSYCACMRE